LGAEEEEEEEVYGKTCGGGKEEAEEEKGPPPPPPPLSDFLACSANGHASEAPQIHSCYQAQACFQAHCASSPRRRHAFMTRSH